MNGIGNGIEKDRIDPDLDASIAAGPPGPVETMRALGIDFGEKRIGLALSDSDGRWALPLAVVERETDRRAAYRIAEIARREGVGVLVLGEPLGPRGETGAGALRARRFGDRLRRAARLPLVLLDETLTTVEAAERLREAGLDEPRGPQRDAVAAQVILQEALDRGLAKEAADEDPGESRRAAPEGGSA